RYWNLVTMSDRLTAKCRWGRSYCWGSAVRQKDARTSLRRDKPVAVRTSCRPAPVAVSAKTLRAHRTQRRTASGAWLLKRCAREASEHLARIVLASSPAMSPPSMGPLSGLLRGPVLGRCVGRLVRGDDHPAARCRG